MFWSMEYKPKYYIQSTGENMEFDVLYSPSGFGYEWKKRVTGLHAAKLAITKHIKENAK